MRLLKRSVQAIFYLLILCLFVSRSASSGFSHDENQFIASGQLLADRHLLPYVDYPFTHVPYGVAFYGLSAALGALAGIIAGGIGGGYTGRLGKQLAAIGTAVQGSGGVPTEAQQAEMASIQSKMQASFRIVAILLVIAVAAMASARYL